MSYSRRYGFKTWITRRFVRQTLQTVFPDHAADIDRAADPGEYGLEDYHCRMCCCFLFSLAVIHELFVTMGLLQLLYLVPSNHDKWIKFEPPAWHSDRTYIKQMFGWNELNFVKFTVAGLPFHWKVVNVFLVFIPRLLVWLILVSSGIQFIMDTSDIVDLLLKSMSLTFILSLDQLIFQILTTTFVKHIMGNLKDYELFAMEQHESEPEEVSLLRYAQKELGGNWTRCFLAAIVPRRLLLLILVFTVFILNYYHRDCITDEEGGLVSKPMYSPDSYHFNPVTMLHFLWNGLEDESSEPFWTMPEVGTEHN